MSITITLAHVVAVLQTALALATVFSAGALHMIAEDEGDDWMDRVGPPAFLVACGLLFATAAVLLWTGATS